MDTVMPQAWDEKASMQPRRVGNGVQKVGDLKTVDLSGPSPSFFLTLLFDDETVLLGMDMDDRKTAEGKYRPTRGAFKMSFGYGGNVETMMTEGSNVDTSLFGTTWALKHVVRYLGYIHKSEGDGWGPVATIGFLCPADMKQKYLNEVNRASQATKNPRFVDFVALPIEKLIASGEEKSAVYDESMLKLVDHDGKKYKMWDEGAARAQYLPQLLEQLRSKE